MSNRAAATALAVKLIDMLIPGSPNAAVLKEQLDALSDSAFHEYMVKLRNREAVLPLTVSNMDPKFSLSQERNLEVAKKVKLELFQHLLLTDPTTGVTFRTPERYLVGYGPLRRQQQLLIKKISIPDSNLHVDELTGQPAGPSKGSKLSFPEMQGLFAQGQDRSIEELMKFRGGDAKAYRAMSRSILETGRASQDAIKVNPTRVKANESLETLLKSMHLDTKL